MTPTSTPGPVIKVLVIDSQPLMQRAIREALMQAPSLKIEATAATLREGVEMVKQYAPDVILLNLIMSAWKISRAVVDLLKAAERAHHSPRICLYTIHSDPSYIAAALHAGAKGYLNTIHDGVNLVQMIQTVYYGEDYRNSDMDTARSNPSMYGVIELTRTERDVLRILTRGVNNKTIADERGIAISTVKKHTSNIFRKLHVRNRSEAVSLALRHNLID